MIKKDKIHFNIQHCDSFNPTYAFIYSCRESGKTTQWVWKAHKLWKKEKLTSIVLRYMISDISDLYISDLQNNINPFLPDDKQIKFKFKKGSIKDGIIDVFIEGDEEIPMLRIIALSNPISRIKSMSLKSFSGLIVWDEFILNLRCGEKYPKGLTLRIKEIWTTYNRCNKSKHKTRLYAFGNPYTKYNPFMADLKVPFNKIKIGDYYYNKEKGIYVEAYQITEELKQYILSHNSLYQFEDTYTAYSFEGESINDTMFKIVEKQPQNYSLRFIFRMNDKYLLIYRDNTGRMTWNESTGRYWVEIKDKINTQRDIVAIDFDNLVAGTTLITPYVKNICWELAYAVTNRDIIYQSVECGYFIEELYMLIK